MKKKVLFINTPAYDRSKAFFPPDIAYLVSAFEKEEIECDVFDANFDSDKIMDIRMLSALYMHRIILFVFLPIVIRFHEFTFCARADQIVKYGIENLLFFKKYGCNSIEIRVENGSSNSLQNYGKGTTVDQNILALNMVRNAKIFPSVDYIMFEPETSLDDLKENLSFIKKSKLWGYYHPVLYSKVLPLEGTQYEKYLSLSDEQYFSYEDVFRVYTNINQFRKKYQDKINVLIDIMNDFVSNHNMINKKQYIWLRTLPYTFFAELVYDQDLEKEINFVDAFSKKEHVDEKLVLIKQQLGV